MNAIQIIERELLSLGYPAEAIIHDYSFSDVLSPAGETRNVELAAFTQVPESYRSAAFGVIAGGLDDASAVRSRRALGAPILFVVGDDAVGVWQVNGSGEPKLIERAEVSELHDVFARRAAQWGPKAVHRAKSLGQTQIAYQLDFVDFGLLTTIEHEVEIKLDRLLSQVLEQLLGNRNADYEEAAFRTTFRLLAAKILLDRGHADAASWSQAPVEDVLAGIGNYYGLGSLTDYAATPVPAEAVSAAWSTFRNAISFRNISSDSLAFVYENTLVTKDTRKRFGTHSTPRQLAEYVVASLKLEQFNLDKLTIFEPFTGAGTFLVAALRRMRDLLPEDLSGEQRHALLVQRIRGAEIDTFGCEVAKLSLILADYPNANGWTIQSEDLFEADALSRQMQAAEVVLCNPPWEDFNNAERDAYPEMTAAFFSKPMAVLHAALDARPVGIGFVLPQGILRQQQYAKLRQRVADLYGRVELTALPDRIFQRAGFEAAVLIATDLRDEQAKGLTHLVTNVVDDSGRTEFLATGRVGTSRRNDRVVTDGDLWIGALDGVWQLLQDYPTLGELAEVYRGLQWKQQANGEATDKRPNFEPGVFKPKDSLCQFGVKKKVYLNIDPTAALYPGPLTRPWHQPKVLANAARLARGPWRIAAAFDNTGLVASQAFFGIWPIDNSIPLEVIEAVLNSPLANAFVAEHATNQHLTNELLKLLPMPKPGHHEGILRAVRNYRVASSAHRLSALNASDLELVMGRLLMRVDAAVMRAYDLPPRLERRVLEFFRGHEDERRVDHKFPGWFPKDFTAAIPLHEYLRGLIDENIGAWTLKAFSPAPDDEVEILRRYVK